MNKRLLLCWLLAAALLSTASSCPSTNQATSEDIEEATSAGIEEAASAGIEELWTRTIPSVCWALSVTDEGNVAAIEVDGMETVLGVYSATGSVIKRWTPPSRTFEYCSLDGEYMIAQYGNTVALFEKNGGEQLWAKSVPDVWPSSVSLSASSGRVVFADQPFVGMSTVWCYGLDGQKIWSKKIASAVKDTSISASGDVAVAGEKYGPMWDEGKYAVYLFSPTGAELWCIETDVGVIDVAMTPQAEHVIAGLGNTGMLFLDKSGRTLWSKDDIGGYVDMSADAGLIVASTRGKGIVALDSSGETLWSSSNLRLRGGTDSLCISDNGAIIVALRLESIYADNVVQVLNSTGEVLFEQEDSTTAPRVAVSPRGRYVAIAFGRRLRLFEVS